MMKTNQTLLGVQSPGDELEIREFRRIRRAEETAIGLFDGEAGPILNESREVFLDAWAGTTGDGHPVHVSYRFGEVTIQVDLPTPEGGRKPLTVMRWKPRLALGLTAPAPRVLGTTPVLSRVELARLAEDGAELAEIRALNGSKPRLLGESELLGWLRERNLRFAMLAGCGLAGGRLRFRIVKPEPPAEKAE